MPSSVASSSGSGSGSDSETSVRSVDLKPNGSRKRRRLSPIEADIDDDSDPEEPQPVKPLPTPTSTISRIRAKQAGSSHKEEDVPASIRSAIKDQKTSFATINVDPWLVASLANMAIKHPTGIQKGCIPEILKGRDCIGGSRTGSGKTVAFAVPILQQWAKDPVGIFAVVLTPTRCACINRSQDMKPSLILKKKIRELALQIFEQFKAIAAPQSLKPILVTGGGDMRAQAIDLSKRPHIVIATPGRLAHHINTSGEDTICGLRRARFVVLDEADRLLASGHGSMLPDVETCLSVLPPSAQRQTCLFTATVTPEVRALKDMPRSASKPPVFVCEVDTAALAIPPTLRQTYQLVNVVHKEKYLHVLLSTPLNVAKSIVVFANRTSTANLLEYMLRLLDHRVTALHSKLPQSARVDNLARFRARAARILVATDVAARGLDIPDVGLVVNYDLPRDPDDYIHRVGRTARAGREGTSISLVGQRDVSLVQAIEGRVGRKMEEYGEEGVSVEGRVVRDALAVVGEKKREALLAIEEGRDVKGKRKRGGLR
ncbi:putative RNA helicase [Zalaria obscura]|uniref:RNA helicase n=1 Tax=Zalaria obscura TaxID=2024903 RepID=A0ACC3SGB8_9PEZI